MIKAKWESTCSVATDTVYNFNYTGGEQTFTTPCDGYYKLEVWGAQGGEYSTSSNHIGYGGYGGYSTGVITGSAKNKIFLNVGGSGVYNGGKGYNGGGNEGGNRAGGGATHIANISGLLKNLSSNKQSILIVAGGGGASGYWGYINDSTVWSFRGGSGGGYTGVNGPNVSSSCSNNNSNVYGRGGTQTDGGSYGASFGQGGNYTDATNAPGGGGWYGGGAGYGGWGYYGGAGCPHTGGGGGGSGYIGSPNLISGGGITKHMTCYSCTTSTTASTRTNSNTNVSGTATADYSKTGNGYARITYLGTSI